MSGFYNWKKSLEKFRKQNVSKAYKEIVMKLSCKRKRAKGVDVMISSQLITLQATQRAGLLNRLRHYTFCSGRV